MSKKAPTPSFVAEFELESTSKGFRQLDKQLNAYRQIYNATLGELKKNLDSARASDEWKRARQLPRGSQQSQVCSYHQKANRRQSSLVCADGAGRLALSKP